MKLTILSNPKFVEVLQSLMVQQLPIQTTVKLRSVVKDVSSALQQYETTKNELLNKYGKKDDKNQFIVDEKTGQVVMDEANQKAFVEEYTKLIEADVKINSISIQELEGIKLSVAELTILDGIII